MEKAFSSMSNPEYTEGLDSLKGAVQASEAIGIEEIIEINNDLLKYTGKARIDTLKGILKNLGNKQVTMKHLVKSGIGKTLTRIVAKTEHGFDDKELTERAQNLIDIWKQQARAEKEKKTQEEEKQQNKEKEAKAAELQKQKKFTVPHIPAEVEEKLGKLKDPAGNDYSRITRTLIEDIQTPAGPGAVEFSNEELAQAAGLGLRIAREILETIDLKHKREQKFRTLVYAIGASNPQLRVSLINGDLGPKTIVAMKEQELGSEEYKKRIQEQQDYAAQASRSDAMQVYMQEKQTDSAMYQCVKCKSKKVTMKPMQTRGADEPMTEFYSCMQCGKQWKICP